MDTDDHDPPRTWSLPTSPLYHTKGKCGVKDIPIVNVPETARVVEVVVQNLSPAAHTLHMHGAYGRRADTRHHVLATKY